MRLGVLDVGAYSAQLQVADVVAGAAPRHVRTVKVPTRLAEEIGADGAIGEAGIQRVVRAVARTGAAARRSGAELLYPYVTAAIRDASNRDVVLARIQARTGLVLGFMTGEQEALLTYAAVRAWCGWRAGTVLNIDIGGGSTELVLGDGAAPQIAVSLPLGARELSRSFLTSDPPTPDQLRRLQTHVRQQTSYVAPSLRCDDEHPHTVVTSKVFKQLARMGRPARGRKGDPVPDVIAIKSVRQWIPRLAATTAEQRARFRGVDTARAGQILGGAVVAYETMRSLGITTAELSPWALREGVMLEHLSASAPIDPIVLPARRRLYRP
ncbi:Ppx/GppA phosphatase family protein [Nocardia brasiliensis]|uniref:Ppx/GppA phosphatase family protein n=1 Tax=Nocardia brasiliensis TaxID=37326 RepID=UPI0036722B08